jgi:hypothetical protein
VRRLVVLAVAVGALIAAPAVLADTPLFATTDNTGVVHGGVQYVLTHSSLVISQLAATAPATGTELRQLTLPGYWYFPNTPGGPGGLSHDGKTLLLVNLLTKTRFAETRFIVVDPVRMKEVRRLNLYASLGRPRPPFLLTDALSPDASRLYATAYTDPTAGLASPCFGEYGFDLRSTERVSITTDEPQAAVTGTAMTRATSADGRWDYTLYREASGASFIQVLDTVGAAVHCVDLPTNDGALAGISLDNNDRMLVVDSDGGTPKVDVAVGSWHISQVPAAFPWVWLAAGVGGVALLLAGGWLVLRRRRGEEVAELAS